MCAKEVKIYFVAGAGEGRSMLRPHGGEIISIL